MASSCEVCHRRLGSTRSGLRSIKGSCNHIICLDCINSKDAQRRSQNVAVGPTLPCPVPSCGSVGQFIVPEVEVIDLCSDVEDGEVSSSTISNDETISPSEMLSSTLQVKVKIEHNGALEPPDNGVLVTPAPLKKVKTEHEHDDSNDVFAKPRSSGYDSDYSRFSQLDDDINPMKEETDDEEEELTSAQEKHKESDDDDESRFSNVSHIDETVTGGPELETTEDQPLIKEEPTFAELERREAVSSRKWGDRSLLARQSKVGMMKLGGGNQASHLYPVNPEERNLRMGGRYAMAYNELWNFGAPRYGGQPYAHVTMFPREDGFDPFTTPFSVFVRRCVNKSALGWEYCGEYVLLSDLRGTMGALSVSSLSKNCIVDDIQRSLKCPNGHWHERIDYWRNRILNECLDDPSPAGPTRLIRYINEEPEPNDEGKERDERREKESKEKATSAAKARACGLDNVDISDIEFAKRLVHYDDFYGSYAIKFVSYDESMYSFVKEGETTKNKYNKTRAPGEPCAKASDWYNVMDQQVEGGNAKEIKKTTKKRKKNQRKRKRS